MNKIIFNKKEGSNTFIKICWFSTGISSFVACYLAKDIMEDCGIACQLVLKDREELKC